IHTDKPYIFQFPEFFCVILLHRAQQDTGITFNPDKIDIRMLFCHGKDKTPFSHPDLNPDRLLVSKHLAPASPLVFRSFYNNRMSLDRALGSWYISKSHE